MHGLWLDGCTAEGFGLDRGRQGVLAHGVGRRHIRAMADQLDVFTKAVRVDLVQQRLCVVGAALVVAGHQDKKIVDVLCLQFRRRLDDQRLALPLGQARRQQEAHAGIVGDDAPFFLEIHDLADVEGFRIEALQIDAPRDGDDAFGRDLVGLEDVVAREFGIGDGQVAARHLAVVPTF